MNTVVYPPQSGIGRSRTVNLVTRPLTGDAMHEIVDALADAEIYVRARRGTTVHLWPTLRPLTTADEVTVLRAFAAVTDARLAWHGAVA